MTDMVLALDAARQSPNKVRQVGACLRLADGTVITA